MKNRNYSNKVNFLMIVLLCITIIISNGQKIYIHSPVQLFNKYPKGIKVNFSPIGYHPRSGQLDGTITLAQPLDACQFINNVQNQDDNVFVLVNDQKCLESTKAKNVLKSGGIVGLMKQNINTTLHDKQTQVVHIPIVQIIPNIFDQIVDYIKQNPTSILSVSLQFISEYDSNKINSQIWMSPTQIQTYKLLLNMQNFLHNQQTQINFIPKYVTHSQKQKKRFIGCYSNGMYCPVQIQYDGKQQGKKVIQQTLRQIIIRQMGIQKWWAYIKYYYVQCLHNNNEDIFLSNNLLDICSKNSMILANINISEIQKRLNQSFLGSRRQVDDNILLNQQRQDYIRQRIQVYPTILINKKQYNLSNYQQKEIQLIFCKNQHQMSTLCDQLINGKKLQKQHWFVISGIIIILVIVILIGYKVFMNIRMKKQMKNQVKSTLQQYYRYMDTLQAQNNSVLSSSDIKNQKYNQINQNNIEKNIEMETK